MDEAFVRDEIAKNISSLELGLELLDIEKYLPSEMGTRSFIDILAKDKSNKWVIIEVKKADASSRQAIHEIYKYVEAVKEYLGARDDEIRAIIASTEWRELLVPFSRFVEDTKISVSGLRITISDELISEKVSPIPINGGRVLSPWHELNLYVDKKNLEKGILSYQNSCKKKGLNDFIIVVLEAHEDFHEREIQATTDALIAIKGNNPNTIEEIAEITKEMDKYDFVAYFVPKLYDADEYLEMTAGTPTTHSEAKEYFDFLEGDELLSSLQDLALYSNPKTFRDRYEIGYAAKFKAMIENSGWKVKEIKRFGAYERNKLLSDEVILSEIMGETGTSGQRLKRTIKLSDNSEYNLLMDDISECLPNNTVWEEAIKSQILEAKNDFENAQAHVSIFAPSTGIFTLFHYISREDGILYVPSYHIIVGTKDLVERVYLGELVPAENKKIGSIEFADVINKYYNNDIGNLLLTASWSGYEKRDIDILEDLKLTYSYIRCDFDNTTQEKKYYEKKLGRWKETTEVIPYKSLHDYMEMNSELSKVIYQKINPRYNDLMCDGSPSENQLAPLVQEEVKLKGQYYIDPPDKCDICSIPLTSSRFMADTGIVDHSAWANMCADCAIFYGEGIGWGKGQLYEKQEYGRWLLVAGINIDDDENEN